jgi:hypothetical protein
MKMALTHSRVQHSFSPLAFFPTVHPRVFGLPRNEQYCDPSTVCEESMGLLSMDGEFLSAAVPEAYLIYENHDT